MTALRELASLFASWMDAVAAFIVGGLRRVSGPGALELVETETGTFTMRNGASVVRIADGRVADGEAAALGKMLRGGRANLVLLSDRFLLRPLELPKRAAEFLDGVVRAQIDRLTPWNAADAAFGWSKPREAGADRIAVTVAATARTQVVPYVQALTALGARGVTVSTSLPGDDGAPASIRVFEQTMGSALDATRVRRAIVAVLAVATLLAISSLVASTMLTAGLDTRQNELARRITERRAALRSGLERANVANTPLRALERRKYESPTTVLVLEALSQLLPDHTYVIELRIEADKLRVIGITRDAPGLIRLIEQNSMFSRATFFAPTTRAPSDPGERFHIEVQIEPVLARS